MQTRRSRATYRWSGSTAVRAVRDVIGVTDGDFRTFSLDVSEGTLPQLPRTMSMAGALEKLGMPVSDLPPDRELIDLLVNAAEIEHGLMVQYLYAAATAGDPDVAAELRRVAVEEMGHFLTVQNLLISFGSEPHLAHADWREAGFFTPFAFKLEAASRLSMAKYTIAEMPSSDSPHIDDAQRADLPQILKDASASAGGFGVEAHRVGLLYMKIYWLLRISDAELPAGQPEPWIGFPVSAAAAECPGEHVSENLLEPDRTVRNGLLGHWKKPGHVLKIRSIRTRADALQAVADVAAQGEGFGGSADGHFDKFVKVWRLASCTVPAFTENPWYLEPGEPATLRQGDQITNPVAVAFARLGDRSYEVVVLTIALYLLLRADAPDDVRRQVASASIDCMNQCLAAAIRSLSPLQAGNGTEAEPKACGLPYLREPLATAAGGVAVLSRIEVLKAEMALITAEATPMMSTALANKAAGISTAMTDVIWPGVQVAAAHV